jgi:hypothetical protein
MRKRLLAVAVCTIGVALTSVATAGTAAAAPPEKTGCPGGFELRSVDAVLEDAAPGFEDAIRAADANDDDQLCYKRLPEPIPLFEPTFLFDDNKFPNP